MARARVTGGQRRYADDPHFRDLLLFNEYFHGDDGRGIGASHQTGWTALVISCLESVARSRRASEAVNEELNEVALQAEAAQ